MEELTPSRRLPAGVADAAAPQSWVVTREQLAACGIGYEGVGSRVRQGIWRALGPRVVVLHSGSLSAEQRRWVATLHAGPGAALALGSAAEAGGLEGLADDEVHVAVEHGREVADLIQPVVTVRVHQTRNPDEDLVPMRLPTRHSLARAVVEMASGAAYDNRARALIAAAVQQRLVRPEQLRDFIERRPTLPRRRLIRETVEDVAGGAHSLPELDFSRALRRAGLPQPTRQRKLRRPNGTWYLDNDFDEWRVTVEINGTQHDALPARESDDARRFGLQVRGRIVVDISSYVARRRPAIAVLRTAEALLARGWEPDRRALVSLLTLAEQERWAWVTHPARRRTA